MFSLRGSEGAWNVIDWLGSEYKVSVLSILRMEIKAYLFNVVS